MKGIYGYTQYNESRICMEGNQVLMKKHVMIMVSVLLTVFLAACSTRQSNSNISNSQQDTFEPSVAEPQESQQEEPLIGDTESYQLLAANLIEQYKNNTIEINDMFPAPPEGFEFPENLSDLEFSQNEMGYFVTSIIDKNNTYEMYISIDDMTYDGVKPGENPHIDSVFFNKIS